MTLGCIGRPGTPHRATDMDVEHFVFLVDGLLRDNPNADVDAIDALYDRRPAVPADDRAATIAAFLNAVDE